MKKLLKFIRGLLIFIGWTGLFTVFSNFLISLIWNFDFMSARSWQLLSEFWNSGGVIKTTSDVLLLASLFMLPLLCLVGFILVLKINYANILLWPVKFLDNLFSSKSDNEPERIVLKNQKSSRQIIEDIKSELDSLKPEKAKEAGNIRSEITKKLSEEIKN